MYMYFINYMEIILKLEMYIMYTSMMRINLNIFILDMCEEQSFDYRYNLINSILSWENVFMPQKSIHNTAAFMIFLQFAGKKVFFESI